MVLVGHRQSEERGCADRPGAGADRRAPALRQLQPARRCGADPARRARPGADRRGRDAVGRVPRSAAAADAHARRGSVARRAGRRAGGGELRPQACARASGGARLRPRNRGAARLLQRRRIVRRQRQPDDRRRQLDRSRRTRRMLRAAKGLCVRREGRAGASGGAVQGRARHGRSAPIRTSNSVELGITAIDQYVDTLGGISRAVTRAKGGATAPVYIGDQTQGSGKVRSLQEQVALETRTRILNPGVDRRAAAPRL